MVFLEVPDAGICGTKAEEKAMKLYERQVALAQSFRARHVVHCR